MQRQFEARAQAHAAAVREALGWIDPVVNSYYSLASDPEVEKALGDLRRATKTPYRLGPTFDFLQAVRVIKGEVPSIRRPNTAVTAPGGGFAGPAAAGAAKPANRPATLLRMGRGSEQAGRPKVALGYYRELVDKFDGTPEAKEAQSRIKAIEIK